MTDLIRMAQASSWEPEARTAKVVLSTDANVGDGFQLVHTRQAIRWPERPVPVVVDHKREVSAVVGAVSDLALEALNGGTALVGRLQLDGPAADQAEPLLRTGAARWSIGARIHASSREMGGDLIRATDWSPGHLALVVEPADMAAITRSHSPSPDPMTEATQTTTEQTETQLDRAAQKLELAVRRAASEAKLPEESIQRILQDHRGGDVTTAITAVVREYRQDLERRAPVTAGHPARFETGARLDEPAGLQEAIHRTMRGDRQGEPLWLALRAAGLGKGGDAASVWRSALSAEGNWLSRGFHSTSDLPNLLTASGNRRLQERFEMAETGIRRAAGIRPLSDFRSASVLDVGLVGSAKKVLEGGEVTFGSVNESATSYKPTRYALGLSFTPEALANDDLAALDLALAELSDSMMDAEAAALVDLLEGASNGRNAPDGQALFHSSHANSVSAGPLAIASIGAAVQKLREQKAVGGRYITQDPAVLMVGTAHETTARQLLSDAINAAQASNVNPWSNLEIAVEPRLSGTYAYIVGSRRRPLELGRLTDAPVMISERDFSTSAYRAKVEHAFGVAVCEHRSIVRIPTAS